jgi:hypothetical protein
VLATAVIGGESILAELDGRDPDSLSLQSRQVLEQVPDAAVWARSFTRSSHISARTFRAQTAPCVLSVAVEGIALACAPDAEQRLVGLLAASIADCQELIPVAGYASHDRIQSPASR